MVSDPKPISVVWPVVCRSCHEKQTVHLSARTGPGQWSVQSIKCAKCGIDFDIIVPDRFILDGPFKQAVESSGTTRSH